MAPRRRQARALLAARVPQGLRMRSAMRRGVATACRRGHEGPLDSKRLEGGRARSRLDVVDAPRAQCGGRRCFHRGLDTKLIVVRLARKHVEVRTSGSTTSRGFAQRALHEEVIRALRESEEPREVGREQPQWRGREASVGPRRRGAAGARQR